MSWGMLESGWDGARPLWDGALLLAAFLSGVLVAVRLRGARPSRPASGNPSAPRPAALPPEASLAAPARPATPASALAFGHEMKNYLCTIKGSARLLRLGPHGKEQADIIDRIDRVVERLETIAFKDIAASPAAAPDVLSTRTRETLDLAAMARASVRLHFAHSAADFPCHVSEPLPLVTGDPHRLEQVFRNLFGNALEAGASSVSTRFRRIGGELEIAIEDDGRGCSEEVAARIFEPFFSTKGSWGEGGRESKPARGLGLFIVQTIVENHGGRIRATSKNGRGDGGHGLVVYLNLPAASVPASAPSQIPTLVLAPAGGHPVRSAA